MKKLINIALISFVDLASMVSCYNNFDEPDLAYVYTDEDFSDCQIISIKSLKDSYSSLVSTGNNSVIGEDLVISGKVISTDSEGSIYKSLFILDHDDIDGSAAIELRLYASNYVQYPVGTTIYVRLNGLSIGDYGGMLSIGASSIDPDYAHTTIEGTVMLKEHIFKGEKLEMESRDTLVLNSSNYLTMDHSELLARLVRIEDIESCFDQPKWTSYSYPNYFSSSSDNFDWNENIGGDLETPTLAYYGLNPETGSTVEARYYGNAWFTYNSSSSSSIGQYVTRISGYAKFRAQEIPADGSTVDITAIFSQYVSGSYVTYQLQLNYGDDLVTK